MFHNGYVLLFDDDRSCRYDTNIFLRCSTVTLYLFSSHCLGEEHSLKETDITGRRDIEGSGLILRACLMDDVVRKLQPIAHRALGWSGL